ncbi:MAG: hypothetical protein ACFFAN_11890 [Promethearchaeota archaeon]
MARKFVIKILPIKGTDITWESLSQIDMSKYDQDNLDLSNPKERFEFDGENFDKICDKLREYIKTRKSELKKHKKEMEELENTKKTIIDFIKSREFRDVIKENLEDFERIFQNVSNNQITTLEYYLKLGQILNKKLKN